MLEDDDELAYAPEEAEKETHLDGRPAWMRTLTNSLATWLQLVPEVSYFA